MQEGGSWWRHVWASKTTVALFFAALLVGAFVSARLIDTGITSGGLPRVFKSNKPEWAKPGVEAHPKKKRPTKKPISVTEIPFICPAQNESRSCPARRPMSVDPVPDDDNYDEATCPDYFRWIHEDLRPWKESGISREMVEGGQKKANFRLVIINGTAHIESYSKAFQTRDVFTEWGILQLLRRYPGRLPDLDLMFNCDDRPVVKADDYKGEVGKPAEPPPVFHYCGEDGTLDIMFPDWSFWGWPEINIKPWEPLQGELKEGNEKQQWVDREPFAFWKGNPSTSGTRQALLNCNPSKTQEWNVRAFTQDWIAEMRSGFKNSDLASQCTYRYKIYVEGIAWSVSQKYIMACNSMSLVVKPRYYDFFTRGLMPVHHYWPLGDEQLCRSVKLAVHWGNTHKTQAQAIGKAGSNFMQEGLKMEFVYDYMFHILNEYAKLLTYKPTVPPKAVEFCAECMACPARGLDKDYMMETMEKYPKVSAPCTLPPPYEPKALKQLLRKKEDKIKQVEEWEKREWETLKNKG